MNKNLVMMIVFSLLSGVLFGSDSSERQAWLLEQRCEDFLSFINGKNTVQGKDGASVTKNQYEVVLISKDAIEKNFLTTQQPVALFVGLLRSILRNPGDMVECADMKFELASYYGIIGSKKEVNVWPSSQKLYEKSSDPFDLDSE